MSDWIRASESVTGGGGMPPGSAAGPLRPGAGARPPAGRAAPPAAQAQAAWQPGTQVDVTRTETVAAGLRTVTGDAAAAAAAATVTAAAQCGGANVVPADRLFSNNPDRHRFRLCR